MTHENANNNHKRHGSVAGAGWITLVIAIAFIIISAVYWSGHRGNTASNSNPAPKNATTGSGSAAR
jgi:hypothetical protein